MRTRYRLLFAAIFLVLMSGVSWGASISGSVVNNSGKSGRIYLSVQWDGGWDTGRGVSIAAPGSFQINGMQPGTYRVKAFLDPQGTGIRHANDPSGISGELNVSSGNVSAGTIYLNNPSSVAAEAPEVMVYRGSGGNIVLWGGPETDEGVIADKYTIYWNTTPSLTGASSKVVPSGYNDFFAHAGGSATLYYQIKADAGTTSASSGWIQGPAASATGSVKGKVYFTGVPSVTGPLFVALVNESVNPPVFSVAAVSSPTSGGSYTINNVSAGTYEVFAFLDLNNSGTYDTGDVGWLDNDDFSTKVTVATSQVTAADLTLAGSNASAHAGTSHGKNQWGEWYNLNFYVQSMLKRVVNVQIASGPQISSPVDLSVDDGVEFETWINVSRPTVGDTYDIKVTYSDGTSETVSKSITAVLDALPTSPAPVGYIPFSATPTFSWTAPSSAPAEYIYSLWVNENNGGDIWDVWGIPSSQTSIVYGSQGEVDQEELTDGATYNWTLNLIDRDGNRAEVQNSFTPTTAPALNGFSPPGGTSGTTVTISGINFNSTGLNTVLFNGVTATVSAATTTSLTVTVPSGATTGKIQVSTGGQTLISDDSFIVAAPVNIRGIIQTSAGAVVAGARVEKSDDSTFYTTTAADGSFTLDWLFPGQNVTLKITKTGYVPTYTADFYLQENLDLRSYPSHLYTQAELTSWGVAAGKGVVIGQVLGQNTTPYSPISGVTVTAASSQTSGMYYPVTYFDGATFGGTSTYGNGLFFVPNVDNYDWVNVIATKSPWSFQSSGFSARADSVTEGGVFGTAYSPYINSFSPISGKAGTSVTISGGYFSTIMAENTVKFNGVTATVTAATSSSLTVTVPSGATTGQISVTTVGGTYAYWQNFTRIYTLTTSVTGTGQGTVTSTSPDSTISCQSGSSTNCSSDYAQSQYVELSATTGSGSSFGSWSGCDSVADTTCYLTLNADRTVTATFSLVPNAKIGTGSYYATIMDAYAAATSGSTIKARVIEFTGPHDFGLDKSVTLKGGYSDVDSDSQSGYTTLGGPVSITSGGFTVENLAIK